MANTATYTQLKDGNWGIRSTVKVAAGSTVTVTKKSGGAKTETVSKVLWDDGKVWLCSVKPKAQHGTRSRSGGLSKYCQSPGECHSAMQWDAPDRLCLPCSNMYDRMTGE